MTIFGSKDNKPSGHAIAGGGDGEGVSEIAYAYMPEAWGKGIGSNVVEKIVKEWAPEVRRIGLGINTDKEKNHAIINAFNCFGGKPLERLDATASPANPGSWKILVKNRFEKAGNAISDKNVTIEVDPDQCRSHGKVDYKAMENCILEKFYGQDAACPLQEGVRYLMIDPDGNKRTLSKHKGYNRLKYHFEYYLS